MINGLNWTSPDVAIAPEGRFVIQPAHEQTAAGVTQFSLTFTRTDGARHRQTFTTIGLFESPEAARLTAEIFPRD